MTKLSPNGKDQIVKLVTKGELLGQRSMISDEPANLSAVALEDMEVCFIPKTEILGFFDKNNQFSMNVMKTICGDLKKPDDHYGQYGSKNSKRTISRNTYLSCKKLLEKSQMVLYKFNFLEKNWQE